MNDPTRSSRLRHIVHGGVFRKIVSLPRVLTAPLLTPRLLVGPRLAALLLATVLGLWWLARPSTLPGASAADFDPEAHFPRDTYLFALIDLKELREGFRESAIGKLLAHPAFAPALEALPALFRSERELRDGLDAFEQAVGLDPLAFAKLFEGELALTVPSVDPRYGPGMLLSVRLGSKRREILATVERFGALFLQGTRGGSATTAQVEGHTVTAWPVDYGPSLRYVTLGDHLVFGVGPDLEGAIRRFEGKEPEEDCLRFNKAYSRGKLQVTGTPGALTVHIDWERIREMTFQVADSPRDQEEARSFLGATGLGGLSAATLRFGFRDGAAEMRLALDAPGELQGALRLLECIGPAAGGGALAFVPAGAKEIAVFSIAKGQLARVVEEVRVASPTAAGLLGALAAGIEERTGLSLERDLAPLPSLDVTAFSADPPAGGAVPDLLALVRRGGLEPYLALLDRASRRLGGKVSATEVEGRPVASVAIREPRPIGVTLAFTPLDEEWMLVAESPQAIARYFAHYRKGPTAKEDPRVAELLASPGASRSAWALLCGGKDLLALYNDAVSAGVALAPLLREQLAPWGIDPTLLPPGEELAGLLRDGSLVLERTKEGVLVRTRALVPNMLGSRTLLSRALLAAAQVGIREELGVDRRQTLATERLRSLGAAMRLYAVRSGTNAFPHDPTGSPAALEKLLEANLIRPDVLVHPFGNERSAEPGLDGKPRLGPENVSYEIVPWKQGPADHGGRILLYEKRVYTGGGRNVLFVDGSVRFLPEGEFAALLEEQTARYGRKE